MNKKERDELRAGISREPLAAVCQETVLNLLDTIDELERKVDLVKCLLRDHCHISHCGCKSPICEECHHYNKMMEKTRKALEE